MADVSVLAELGEKKKAVALLSQAAERGDFLAVYNQNRSVYGSSTRRSAISGTVEEL